MLHVAKGLVTPRCTVARLLVLLVAGTIVVGCARNGGNPASDATSAAAPNASAGDQEPASIPAEDKAPAETAPVLRDGRWYAPGQSVDSPHPYGFFEKDPKAPCILVSPRGAVWLSEDTPVFRSLMRPEHGDRAMGGWLVMSQSFVSLSDENFASSITHAHPGEVEFVVSPVKDQRNATIATSFGVTAEGRYFKSDLRPSTQQREFGIERKVTEGPLRPGCPANIGKDVIEYQFELSNRHGGNYVEAVQQALQQPVDAVAGVPQEATPGITNIGSWTILDAKSGMAAEVAKSGAELKFLARTEEVAVGKGGTRLLQVMCHRPAGEPWVLSIFGSYAGEVQISFDGGPTERFQHPWNPPGGAKFDAESMERLIQRLLLARQVMMKGQKGSSAFDASRKQWTGPATFNVDGFNQLLATHIAACPAPEARALAAAYASTQQSTPPAGAAQIPEGFRGTWAVDRNSCAAAAEIGSPPDPGAVIDAASINRYENHCEVTRLRTRASDMVVADVTCNAEGETFDNSVTLILVGDRLRVDGAGDYTRCTIPEQQVGSSTVASRSADRPAESVDETVNSNSVVPSQVNSVADLKLFLPGAWCAIYKDEQAIPGMDFTRIWKVSVTPDGTYRHQEKKPGAAAWEEGVWESGRLSFGEERFIDSGDKFFVAAGRGERPLTLALVVRPGDKMVLLYHGMKLVGPTVRGACAQFER